MPDSATQVEVTRTFDAPREQVFEAWTDPDQIVAVVGPRALRRPASTP